MFYILVRGGGLEQVLKLQEPLCFASSELELLVLLRNLFRGLVLIPPGGFVTLGREGLCFLGGQGMLKRSMPRCQWSFHGITVS